MQTAQLLPYLSIDGISAIKALKCRILCGICILLGFCAVQNEM